MNGKVLAMTRCLLQSAQAPKFLWAEAADYAVYILNCLPHSANPGHVSPNHRWDGVPPKLESLFVWGSPAYVLIPKERRKDKKLGDVSVPGIIVGVARNRRAYRVYVPSQHCVFESNDISIDEYAVIRRSRIARNISTADGAEQSDFLNDDGGMNPTRLLISDDDAVDIKQPTPAAPITVLPTTPTTAYERTTPPTPVTVPHAQTPTDTMSPTTPLRENLYRIPTPKMRNPITPRTTLTDQHTTLPPTTTASTDYTVPPLPPTDIPKWRGLEEESAEDEGPSDVQRRGELRRSRRATKGTKPENIADVYANERENAWRKKRGLQIFRLMRYGVNYVYALEEDDDSVFSCATSTDTPSYEEGMNSTDAVKWKAAMEVELANLLKRHTWEPAVLPAGRKPVGNKWVFRVKRNDDRSINKYKARLTAKGFSQIHGVDFNETFSPTIRVDTMRTMFACAAEKGPNISLFHWDVIGAYLWADLDEEIYMKCPAGVILPRGMNCVRLLKALYGLRQAGRLWHQLLKKVLLDLGFHCTEEDACLFIHHGDGGKITMLGTHVDDLFGWSTEPDFMLSVKTRLDTEFELVDNGKPSYLLGIHIVHNEVTGAIKLHQEKYITDILERFGMINCHPVRSPADHSVHLEAEDDSELLDRSVPYREAVGALLYAAVNTKPSIAYAVCRVAKFVEAPRQSHWTAVKRIMRFLKGNPGSGVCYQRTTGIPKLTMFCDADYAADVDSRKSMTGYVAFIAGGPVAWRSGSQKGTALSTCVAELYALTEATVHVIWHRNLLGSMSYKQLKATDVFEDNQAAIQVCINDVMTRRIKCVGVRLSFLRDQLHEGIINLLNVSSAENVADIFTKALTVPVHEYHQQRLEV